MAAEQKRNCTKKVFSFIACLVLTTMWSTGCTLLFPHDPATHNNLITLKAEAVQLVETFDTKSFDANEAAITDFALKFRKAYSYEKGKVKRTSDIMKQLDRVWRLVSDDIAVYRENGSAPRDPKYFHEAAVVLGKAFDSALAAE